MPRLAALPDLSPAKLDLDVYRGDRLSLLLQLRSRGIPINIATGWSFEAHIRTSPDGPIIAEFDITQENVGPVVGTFRLQLTEDITQILPGRTIWDLQSIDMASRTRTLLRGNIMTTPDVTWESYDQRGVRRG